MNQRKRQVLDSALQLFIEKGFHNTSIQDILKKAQISKGTFYNYFSSKNECVLAIMEQARYEASLRRHEMLVGKDPADEDLLIEQIIVLMQINKKQNLITIFEGIFQSNDKELQDVLTRFRLLEFEWVSNRLIDIFGEVARPYTLELTVLFFGMVHHLAMTYRKIYGVSIETKEIVKRAFINIKAILPVMIKNKDSIIIPQGSLQLIDYNSIYPTLSKEIIIEKLTGFKNELEFENTHTNGLEFTESVLDELNRSQLRIAVIQTLLKPFREAFMNTTHEAESIEIANMVWYYFKTVQDPK